MSAGIAVRHHTLDELRPENREWGCVLDLEVPSERFAGEPPEARGVARDGVRLMVSEVDGQRVRHGIFDELARFLSPGDLLVVNASGTINAALAGWWESGEHAGEPVHLHLSSPLPFGAPHEWVVEPREVTPAGTAPLLTASAGERVRLGHGGRATLVEPYGTRRAGGSPLESGSMETGRAIADTPRVRLWVAALDLPGGVLRYARLHGSPIRYRYVRKPWPLAAHQTVFATEPGSAEMPSAGRPFSRAVLERLEAAGIGVAPLVLHTGVASLEADEPPYPERYRVPSATAEAVNAARAAGRRVIAVGTTVVRGLETVASADGRVRAGAGWTNLVVTADRGIRTVDGILTGFHEPRSSHLAMLEAFAGRAHLEVTYRAAVDEGYLWHEFGDVHLMLR